MYVIYYIVVVLFFSYCKEERYLSLSSPYNHILPVLLLHQPRHPLPHQSLRCPAPPVKAPPAGRENAVVGFQHVVAGAAHDGFRQFRSNEAVHTHAYLVYFFFIHAHSPFKTFFSYSSPCQITVHPVPFR